MIGEGAYVSFCGKTKSISTVPEAACVSVDKASKIAA